MYIVCLNVIIVLHSVICQSKRERRRVIAVKPVTRSNYIINVFVRPAVSFFCGLSGLASLFHLASRWHAPSPGPWHGSGPQRERRAVTRTHNTWTVECFSSSRTPLLSHGRSCQTFFGGGPVACNTLRDSVSTPYQIDTGPLL